MADRRLGTLKRAIAVGGALAMAAALAVASPANQRTARAFTCDDSCASQLGFETDPLITHFGFPGPGVSLPPTANADEKVTLSVAIQDFGGFLSAAATDFGYFPDTIEIDLSGDVTPSSIYADPTTMSAHIYNNCILDNWNGCTGIPTSSGVGGPTPQCNYNGSFLGGDQSWTCSVMALHHGDFEGFKIPVVMPHDASSVQLTVKIDPKHVLPGNHANPDTTIVHTTLLYPDLTASFSDPYNPPGTVRTGGDFTYKVKLSNVGTGTTGALFPVIRLEVDPSVHFSNYTVTGSALDSYLCGERHPTLVSNRRWLDCKVMPMVAPQDIYLTATVTAPTSPGLLVAYATADPDNTIVESDKTNNTASISTIAVIDTTAPTVIGTPDRAPDSNGWYNHPVTVSWSGTDPDDASASLHCSAPITYSGPDTSFNSMLGTCTDAAGNAGIGTFSLKYDATAPVVTGPGSITAEALGPGRVVNFSASATDAISGSLPVTCTPASGANFPLGSTTGTCTATDPAGNVGQASFTILVVDTTPPAITAAAVTTGDGKPYTPGTWTNQSVQVTFNCTDSGAGVSVSTITAPITLSADGQDQSANGSCSDNAGNIASTAFAHINIDKTPPTVTYAGRTVANSAGWNNGNVTLTWICADSLSGTVSSSLTQTISTEGVNQSATGTCTDNAGNSATDVQGGVNIDKSNPTITYTGRTTPNAAGWNNGNVTLTWICADGLSGPVSGTVSQIITTEGANQSAVATCTDNAGNSSSDTKGGVNIDKTAPTITYSGRTAPNGAGWNNRDVTLSWTCADSLSGPVSATVSQTISTEGANQSATGTCTDNADNSATNSQGGVNIDKTPPAITVTSPTAGSYYLNQAVAANYRCLDALSGVAGCAGTVANLTNFDAASLGNKTFTVTAVDVAGNQATITVSYVVTYRICALYDQTRKRYAGIPIPIVLQLCDAAGKDLSSSGIVVTAVLLTQVSTGVTGAPDAAGGANPHNQFWFSRLLGPTGGYIYLLETKGLASGSYVLSFTVSGDPATHTVGFAIR